MTTVNPADPAAGLPAEPFDVQDALPVWRQLANERLMFPLDMDIVAAKIGPERQLFVDNALIARVSNVTREVHQPVRYAGNPVLEATGNAHAFVLKVLPFDESPYFRMWYWSISDWHDWGPGNEIRCGMSLCGLGRRHPLGAAPTELVPDRGNRGRERRAALRSDARRLLRA